MIKVYFETLGNNGQPIFSEQVATFDTEEIYIQCLPALENLAALSGYMLTESLTEFEY